MSRYGRKLITASASENLDTKSERVVHRFIPMLVAENVMRVWEYESGKKMPRVDLWNCVGMKMDKAFKAQDKYACRKDFSSALLADKYAILEEFGVPCEERTIIRDDDSTKMWLNHKIKQLMSSGVIYIEAMWVDICDDCNYLQSLSGLHGGLCTLCSSRDFHQEKKEVLMVDIPKCKTSLTDGRIVHPKNAKHIQGFFDQLPPRMMISKVREYGLSLDPIGLQGYVLDPKIGVALMPELVAERFDLSEITLVQGASVATNASPYTSIMTSGFQHKYVLLPKIPPTTLEEARILGLGFVGRYLPFILMEYNEDITPTQLETARKEYARIIYKIDNILLGLQSGEGQWINLNPEDHQMLSEIARDFINYRVRDGREKLNSFFRTQGRRYAEELRGKEGRLSPMDVDTLEGIVKLFYR